MYIKIWFIEENVSSVNKKYALVNTSLFDKYIGTEFVISIFLNKYFCDISCFNLVPSNYDEKIEWGIKNVRLDVKAQGKLWLK